MPDEPFVDEETLAEYYPVSKLEDLKKALFNKEYGTETAVLDGFINSALSIVQISIKNKSDISWDLLTNQEDYIPAVCYKTLEIICAQLTKVENDGFDRQRIQWAKFANSAIDIKPTIESGTREGRSPMSAITLEY